MSRTLFQTTVSRRIGLLLALLCIVVIPAIAGNQWTDIFTSTACFALAASGGAFMHARLGMVSLAQVGLMGVGGRVALRPNHLPDWPFEINMLAAGLAATVFGWRLALPMTEAEKEADVARALDFVGMAGQAQPIGKALDSFERRLTDVAKCLVGNPRVIMFDEPAGGLSVDETRRLGELILGVHGETGALTLVIDHDVGLIARIRAETLVLDFGRRIAFGPTVEVLADPRVRSACLGNEEAAQ